MPSLKLIIAPLLALASLANASVCKPSSTSSSSPPEPTSTLPCTAYKLAATVPDGRVCGKDVQRTGNGREILLLTRAADLETCVKLCADTQNCESLYVELYDPRESPPFPICFLLSEKADNSQFFTAPSPGQVTGKGEYYEFGCFECDRSD